MPELPEVHRVMLTLEPCVVGRTVTNALLRRKDFCEPPPGARSVKPQDLLEGARINRLARHGKQLAIIADDDRTLCVHLGMSGQVRYRSADPACDPDDHKGDDPTKDHHVHAFWRLGKDLLLFRDPRRFGGLWAFRSPAELAEHRWSHLGPDALTILPELLAPALESTRAIKAVLLDQAVLAGVGNIYADEALFRSGIHPERRSDSLVHTEIESLAASVRGVLAESIAAKGTSFRDYVDAEGNPGTNASLLRVYGRAGEPCFRCGERLSRLTVAQRTTVFCPVCQPRRRPKTSASKKMSRRSR